MFCVLCAVFSVQCLGTAYSVQCTVYSVQCAVCICLCLVCRFECLVQVEDGVFEYAELHEAGGYTTLVREREKRERISLQVNTRR